MADNRTVYHCFVAQCEIPEQVDVVRWLLNNPSDFKVAWIVHFLDKRPADSVAAEQLEENESDIHFYDSSGTVKSHIHGIVKVPKKISPESLSSSFAQYIHFQRCSNPQRYLQYMLHRDFKSSFDKNKHQYEFEELQTNDNDFLMSLCTPLEDSDIVRRWLSYLDRASGVVPVAMSMAVADSDFVLVREIKNHAFFYSRFFTGN